MAGQKSGDGFDPLILNSIYPEPEAILSFEPAPLKTVLREGLVVIDTNVLLVPYSTGKDSLQQIQTTYTALVKENRLVIPGQVLREFAKNRAEKLKTAYQQVSQKRNVAIKRQSYPLLETVPEYQEVARLEAVLDEQLGNYRKAVGKLLEAIGSWYWNDPVSSLYRKLFSPNVVFEPAIDSEQFLSDLANRQAHKIPPGYKDASKEDGGVGDLLIWKAITELGRSRNKHVVFVSGDEKADWWHQSENQPLFPRFELTEEFRRISSGMTFHIVSFSRLLAEFGASDAVVAEVRQEEHSVVLDTATTRDAASMEKAATAERAVYNWLVRTYPSAAIEVTQGKTRPDFIVKTDDATFAYDVKFVHNPGTIARRLREERYRNYSGQFELPNLRKYLVLVTDDSDVLNGLARLLDHAQPIRPGWGAVIGWLQEGGELLEVVRYEP